MTAQQAASWRERALNDEDQLRVMRHDLQAERRLVADLIGQLREPDGTWIEQDRDRLRAENQHLLTERNRLLRERDTLRRKLEGARANLARINERRVRSCSLPAPPRDPEPSRLQGGGDHAERPTSSGCAY
jgi:hypothetical protein